MLVGVLVWSVTVDTDELDWDEETGVRRQVRRRGVLMDRSRSRGNDSVVERSGRKEVGQVVKFERGKREGERTPLLLVNGRMVSVS